jgi:electron transport complex protein RnfG
MNEPVSLPPDPERVQVPPLHDGGVMRISTRTASILLVFTLAFTALMAEVYQLTKPVLEATALDAKRRTIAEVLPNDIFDNDLLADAITLPANPALGLAEPTQLYRARKDGQPAALVFETAATDGYSGEIRLILAVKADGRFAAVRVTMHKETPGLGDYIELKKDKNKARPWITQFQGMSLAEVTDKEWKVKKDGGRIEYYAGATVTPRAVAKAIFKAVKWAEANQNQLFTTKDAKP